MKRLFSPWPQVLLACVLLQAPTILVAAESVEQRLQQLERILRNQSLSDIVLQLQQLQQEVQQLRGEVELQNHTIDALNKRQRDLYLDIDQRLSNLPSTPSAAGEASAPDSGIDEPVSPTQAEPAQPPMAESAPEEPRKDLPPPDPKLEAAAYQSAFNLLKQGRYQESIDAFRDFLAQYSGGSYEDNAQYWLGEARYVSRDFDSALVEFTKVLDNYPSSSKVPGAMLKSGYIYYEKRDWTKARELFNKLQQEYSGSTEARLAGKRLQRMDKEGR